MNEISLRRRFACDDTHPAFKGAYRELNLGRNGIDRLRCAATRDLSGGVLEREG